MRPAIERFNDKFEPEPTSGCWLWTGAVTEDGYGRFGFGREKRSMPAHRAAYELLVGPIPKGLHLDHLCRTPSCVNPAHLEPVTVAENYRRSPITNTSKLACWLGHEFTPENTYRDRRNRRHCRACHNARAHRQRHTLDPIKRPSRPVAARQPVKTILQRFREKFVVDPSGCWLWTAARSQSTDYGVFQMNGKYALAHRASYELLTGPIPQGRVIHHRCNVRACVNPEHLEAVSQRENTLVSDLAPAALNAAKVTCIRGHGEFTTDRGGHRYCKECNRLKQRAFRLRQGA